MAPSAVDETMTRTSDKFAFLFIVFSLEGIRLSKHGSQSWRARSVRQRQYGRHPPPATRRSDVHCSAYLFLLGHPMYWR